MKKRLARLFRHLSGRKAAGRYPQGVAWWLLELPFFLLDLLWFPELLMVLDGMVKWNARPLTLREETLARAVYGEAVDYTRVRIDARAHLGPRQFRFAYVGFYRVKCWGGLPDRVFIHEIVHVWQYARFGSVYIPRALWAQHSGGGYDYGGEAAVRDVHARGGSLLDFNYEQMGEVAADYFQLRQGRHGKYCRWEEGLEDVFGAVVERAVNRGNS